MTVADVKALVDTLTDAEIHTIGDPRLQGGEDWEGATRYKLLAALSAALTRLLAGAAPQQNNRDGTYNPPESRGAVGQGTSLADGPIDTYWHRRRAVEPLHGRITGCLCDACQNERGYHALLAAAAPPPKPT